MENWRKMTSNFLIDILLHAIGVFIGILLYDLINNKNNKNNNLTI